MKRFHQTLLILSTVLASWLGMQTAHELGHVLGAWLTGGEVRKVVLLPWTLSRTELAVNPDPLTVTWAGPLIGALLPLLGWSVAATLRMPGGYLLRFFAGFCLVGNGAYLAGGAFERLGDAGDLRRHGSPLWQLLPCAMVTVPMGLALWHRQGRHFGFGSAHGRVSRPAAYSTFAVAAVITALEILFFPRMTATCGRPPCPEPRRCKRTP